ncbi:hypothetical protein D9M69_525850 [compost metagenome]
MVTDHHPHFGAYLQCSFDGTCNLLVLPQCNHQARPGIGTDRSNLRGRKNRRNRRHDCSDACACQHRQRGLHGIACLDQHYVGGAHSLTLHASGHRPRMRDELAERQLTLAIDYRRLGGLSRCGFRNTDPKVIPTPETVPIVFGTAPRAFVARYPGWTFADVVHDLNLNLPSSRPVRPAKCRIQQTLHRYAGPGPVVQSEWRAESPTT